MSGRIPQFQSPTGAGSASRVERFPDPFAIPNAIGDTVMLDTGFGQVVQRQALAGGFGTDFNPLLRHVDPNFNVFRDYDLSRYQQYLQDFTGVTSKEEADMVATGIDINRDLRESLADHGVIRFAGNFLDPINLVPVPFALGKGFYNGLKIGFAAGGGTIGAGEMVRYGLDPTVEPEEILMTTVGGALFTGLLSGAAGAYKPGTLGKTPASALLKIGRPRKPLEGVAPMSIGLPPFMGSMSGALKRINRTLRSGANQGDAVAKGIDVKPQARPRFEVDQSGKTVDMNDPFRDLGGRVDAEFIPARYDTDGPTVALRQLEVEKLELDHLRIRAADSKHITEIAQETGITEKQLLEDLNGQIKRLSEDIALADDFFKRQDVQKQLAIEAQRGDGDTPAPRNLDELEDVELSTRLDEHTAIARSELREFTEIRDTLAIRLSRMTDELAELRGKMTRTDDKRWKTRYGNKISEIEEAINLLEKHQLPRTQARVDDALVKLNKYLDEKIVDDWDLLPTGYNTLLSGAGRQFPYWSLLKNKLRDVLPIASKRFQEFALHTAATPGLNNKGNRLGRTTGRSVESSAIIWHGRFLDAYNQKNQIFNKYLGYGDVPISANKVALGQTLDRVKGVLRKLTDDGSPKLPAPDEKLTIDQFNREVFIAMTSKAEHAIPEVMEAAKAYQKMFREFGREGIELGIFATQRNMVRRIEWIDSQIERWNDAFNDKTKSVEVIQKTIDDLEAEKFQLQDQLEAYKKAGTEDPNESYVHRIWITEVVKANREELISMIEASFKQNPIARIGDQAFTTSKNPLAIRARAEEAYAGILREAEMGGDADFILHSTAKLDWLEARLEKMKELAAKGGEEGEKAALKVQIIERKIERVRKGESTVGGAGPMLSRKLDLDDTILAERGFIETDVDAVGAHYVQRMSVAIEMARMHGDPNAKSAINEIIREAVTEATSTLEGDALAKALVEIRDLQNDMTDLVQIVQGIYQIPDNPAAWSARTLRLLRNFNVLTAMGRSMLMAMGDLGNIVISQGFTRTFRHMARRFVKNLHDEDNPIRMIDREVELAGTVSEVLMSQRVQQFTEMGSQWFASNRIERAAASAQQKFFFLNGMAPWTDMARKLAGGLAQSELIRVSLRVADGSATADELTVLGRLGVNKQQALQFVKEWKNTGSHKHKDMFIADTEGWKSEEARRTFRAAMNTEINRAVPTPGAADKPKLLLKSEWAKVIGQYRGFSIAATHRIMSAGLQTPGAKKYAGVASMIGIAMAIDSFKRPDYISLPLEEQVLRAVELSGVTGILLDLNDTMERASAGSIGLRPSLGMDIRERNPNWANRLGTIGAVPNQWLTLAWAFGSDEAEVNDKARAIRYATPYNNLIWWNEAVNRMQRSAVDALEE